MSESLLLVLGTLGHWQLRKAVLISYMALAEDEEIGRSEKNSSLGENTATGEKADTQAN